VPPEPFGPAEFQTASHVSRETLERLQLFVALLEEWNGRINLVSTRSLQEVWKRHVWDSAQLAEFIPEETKSLVDLGSGAGFPGIVLAVVLSERASSTRIVLFESIAKKGGKDPLEVFTQALSNAKPMVEVKSRRVGGANFQVPVEVRPVRRVALAMRWLREAARKRGEKSMGQRLAAELLEASEGRGGAVKKREEVHRMAEANKAFSHFRF